MRKLEAVYCPAQLIVKQNTAKSKGIVYEIPIRPPPSMLQKNQPEHKSRQDAKQLQNI